MESGESGVGGKSLYEILDVDRGAEAKEIRDAYRRKLVEWHPDKNPHRRKEAEEIFKRASVAFEVLSDRWKRREYDASLEQNSHSSLEEFSTLNVHRRPRPVEQHTITLQQLFVNDQDPFVHYFGRGSDQAIRDCDQMHTNTDADMQSVLDEAKKRQEN